MHRPVSEAAMLAKIRLEHEQQIQIEGCPVSCISFGNLRKHPNDVWKCEAMHLQHSILGVRFA
jgi:hypothetical protein